MHGLHVVLSGIMINDTKKLEMKYKTYRISSNKRPGRLFQICVLRGALNRGRALIRGGGT